MSARPTRLHCIWLILNPVFRRFSKSFGRRKILFVSGIGASVCIALAGICLEPPHAESMPIMAVAIGGHRGIFMFAFFLGYVCFTSFGFMVIPWTLIGELFPTEAWITAMFLVFSVVGVSKLNNLLLLFLIGEGQIGRSHRIDCLRNDVRCD